MAATAPPISPSQLLFGLMEGASWWRPMAEPDQQRGDVVGHGDDDRGEEEGDAVAVGNRFGSSRSAAKEPNAPTQTKTKTVETSPDTGSAAGSTRARYQMKEPATSSTSTSGSAATPLL